MLSRLKRAALFAALLLAVATGTTIQNADPNTVKDLIELTYSNSSTLSHQAGKKEEKTTGVHFSAEEISLGTQEPCECTAKDVKQTLAPFNGPDPPFLPAYRNGKAQVIKLPDQVSDGAACRRADGTSVCGRLQYTFTDLESRLQIKTFPHKGIFWDASENQVTLQPQSTDPTGLHKVLVTANLLSFKDVLETAEIAYVVHLAPQNLLQNEEQPEPSDTGQPRRLQTPGQGYCNNPTTVLNLFNTAALAEQSSFYSTASQTASAGCDGEVMMIKNAPTPEEFQFDVTKVVSAKFMGTSAVPQFWKIKFSQPTSIKTTLFINRDDDGNTDRLDRFQKYTATVGNNEDVTQNPVCLLRGVMTDGSWNMCQNSMIGIIFGVYTNEQYLNFVEAMAFSQEAIQMNALSVSFLGTNTPGNYGGDEAIHAILKNVVLFAVFHPRNTSVNIKPPSGGLATFVVKFSAQILIKGVMLLPGYLLKSSGYPHFQKNVAIYGKTVGGTQHLCGVIEDYYNTMYYEVACNIQANEIILVQKNAHDLRFCGFGALSDCFCDQSSFDPLLFTTPQATPFASATKILANSTDRVQQIQFNLRAPDTVSSVCGNADGISKCGTRQLSFKDNLNGLLISKWPYRGYSFDSVTSILTLDPAQADAMSVITVKISLSNYPAVFLSQDITAEVDGGKTDKTTNPQPCIPDHLLLLNATINNEVTLTFPPLLETSYSVTSQQDFAATFDANVLKVLSKSDSDLGTKSVTVSLNSATLNCTSQLKISFKINSTNQSFVGVSASNTTTQSQNISQGDQKISQSDQESLINIVECHADENNEVTCVNPENDSKFQYDPITQQLFSGLRKYNDTETTEKKIVTLKISPSNSKGEVTLKFSEDVNVEALANTSDTSAAGILTQKEQKQNQKASNLTASEASQYSYLLSPAHLNITLNHTTYINGSLRSGDVDASLLNFVWYAKKITPDSILIQVVFENPLLISSEVGFRDKLNIQLLPTSLKYFTSLKTGQLIQDPLQNVTRVLPTQMKLGSTLKYVENAASTAQTLGQSSVATNIAFQVFLTGSFSQMWSMINALQITISFNEMELQIPGNINMVMSYASDLASFNVFPTKAITSYLFQFSDTDLPGVGFESLGTTVKSLVLYLGSEYLLMHLMLLCYLFYGLTLFFSKYSILCKWFETKLAPNLIWQYFFTFLIESYLGFAVGILLRFEQPKFVSVSDQYDFALACVFCLVVILLPLISFLLLYKNESKLEQKEFKQKFESFYSELNTNSKQKRQYCMYMMSWFLFRRLMTAINLVPMRHETKFVQIASNIWLCLIDACLKLHWDPFESKFFGHTQKMNDIVVLFLSEFMFCFTDLTRSEDDKYLIGWVYLGIFGYLVGSNILVMVFLALRDAFKALKRKIFICSRDRILKQNKEWKQKRNLAERQSQAEAKALKRAVNRIWLNDAQIAREQQKREEKEERQRHERAIVLQELEEIEEVEIEESSRYSQNPSSASGIQQSPVLNSESRVRNVSPLPGDPQWQSLLQQRDTIKIVIQDVWPQQANHQQRVNREFNQSSSQYSQSQSASDLSSYQRDWDSSRKSQSSNELPEQTDVIDMAALMQRNSKKQEEQHFHYIWDSVLAYSAQLQDPRQENLQQENLVDVKSKPSQCAVFNERGNIKHFYFEGQWYYSIESAKGVWETFECSKPDYQ